MINLVSNENYLTFTWFGEKNLVLFLAILLHFVIWHLSSVQ